MDELRKILLSHAAKYPLIQPQDAVKLIYQNEFGGGHIISDEQACYQRLAGEWEDVKNAELRYEPFELLGSGLARIYLSVIAAGICCKTLCRMFIQSAAHRSGTISSFVEKLDMLSELTGDNKMPFTAAELDVYLAEYTALGYPAVSHSAVYRDTYSPAYRVVDARYGRLVNVIAEMDTLLTERGSAVLAIDGRCTAGKSTAASLLAPLWSAPIIRMDDFFLPVDLRRDNRYAEPGGNIHYERFAAEVLPGLKSGGGFSYRPFDCRTCEYADIVEIPASRIYIVEGSYSLHPRFGDYFDIAVFCDIESDEQMKRLYTRNGEYAKVFEKKWIPLEEDYFSKCNIRERCHIII